MPVNNEKPRANIKWPSRIIICEVGPRDETTGMANPKQVYSHCLMVKERFPGVTWNLHFHNTRGMGLANVIAGMMAGIDGYDACIAGFRGCPFAPGATGNIATEDLIHMCHEMGIETGYDLDEVISIGRYLRKIIGHDTSSFVLNAGKCSDLACHNKGLSC